MIVGYARVSTMDQNLDAQLEALRNAGAEKVFSEQKSGKTSRDRPALRDVLDFIREGDILVVTRLDRLGRSMRDLLEILQKVKDKGAAFRCLYQAIDTTTAEGRLMFGMLSAFAEFELTMITERQRDGIERAKALGKYGKRKPAVDVEEIKRLAAAGWMPKAVADRMKVSKRTVTRYWPPEHKVEMPERLAEKLAERRAKRREELLEAN